MLVSLEWSLVSSLDPTASSDTSPCDASRDEVRYATRTEKVALTDGNLGPSERVSIGPAPLAPGTRASCPSRHTRRGSVACQPRPKRPSCPAPESSWRTTFEPYVRPTSDESPSPSRSNPIRRRWTSRDRCSEPSGAARVRTTCGAKNLRSFGRQSGRHGTAFDLHHQRPCSTRQPVGVDQ